MTDAGRGRASAARSLAQHEAGHALVCFLLCGEQVIRHVDLGRTRTYSPLPLPVELRGGGGGRPIAVESIVDVHGVTSYAGSASEVLASRRSGPRSATGSEAREREDREAFARVARSLGASRPADRVFDEYRDEAQRLLSLHWPAAVALAEALAQSGGLDGHRVDALLRSHVRVAGSGSRSAWAAAATPASSLG